MHACASVVAIWRNGLRVLPLADPDVVRDLRLLSSALRANDRTGVLAPMREVPTAAANLIWLLVAGTDCHSARPSRCCQNRRWIIQKRFIHRAV